MADGKENVFNKGLAKTLVQIAREWVKVDDTTLTELKRLAGKLPAPRADLTQKNKRFLRQFDDPAVLQRLRGLPQKLWKQARQERTPNFRTLALAQTALALEILTYMPLRIQNLAELAFDEHLFLRDGPGAVSSLEIPAEEVKNKQPITFDVPPHIARMLLEYRDHIAPKIMGRKPDRVFVNPDGTPKLSQTLSKLVRRMVRKHAGVELSPHQFRHLAAKILLDNSPGAFELVKQLLGHQNLKTTTNAYAGIDTRRASRHHASLLEKLFEDQASSLRSPGPHRRRKPKKPKTRNRGLMPTTPRKHLPFNAWPAQDRTLWARAFEPDVFDDDKTSHLAAATVVGLRTAYARYLGFLANHDPARLQLAPETRIDPDSMKAFVAHLRESCRDTSVASILHVLRLALGYLFPQRDWSWLKTVAKRIKAGAIPRR